MATLAIRRHFALVRQTRYRFYDCRICRTHYVDTHGVTP